MQARWTSTYRSKEKYINLVGSTMKNRRVREEIEQQAAESSDFDRPEAYLLREVMTEEREVKCIVAAVHQPTCTFRKLFGGIEVGKETEQWR